MASARGIAERSGGVPTLLRCRLLECELTEPGPGRSAVARTLASDAAAVGMSTVVQAARTLV